MLRKILEELRVELGENAYTVSFESFFEKLESECAFSIYETMDYKMEYIKDENEVRLHTERSFVEINEETVKLYEFKKRIEEVIKGL